MNSTVKLILLLLVLMVRSCEGTLSGHHCGNKTQDGITQVDGERCVACYFPQNCLQNNTCVQGTYGQTCEVCIRNMQNYTDYFRVGSTCVECFPLPWAAVGFGVYLLVFCFITLINGFTISVCTKLKVLLHFLQLLNITFLVRIRWHILVAKTMAVLTFTNFNSDFLAVGCLFPSWSVMVDYYLRWCTTFTVPILVLIVTFFVDRSMGLLISSAKEESVNEKHWRRRSILRRLLFFVVVVMFAPVTDSAVQVNSCSDSSLVDVVMDYSEDTFLHHQAQKCDFFVFQLFQFAGIMLLVFYSVLLPLSLIFFTLRQRKWSLLQEDSIKFGCVYESYKDRCCYWEAVPMLRKIICIGVAETNVFSITVQVIIQLTLTGSYLISLLLLRPYSSYYLDHPWVSTVQNPVQSTLFITTFTITEIFFTTAFCLGQNPCSWKKTNVNLNQCMDFIANLVVGLLQSVALLTVLDVPLVEDIFYLFILCLAAVLILSLVLMLFIPLESTVTEVRDCRDELRSSSEDIKPHSFLRKNKVAPSPADHVEQIQKNIEF